MSETTQNTITATTPFTFASLAQVPIWYCWREELNAKGRVTKPPRQPRDPLGDHASTNDFYQQTTREIAETGATRLFRTMSTDEREKFRHGVGIVTGVLTDDHVLIGLDLDACIRADRSIEQWGIECLDALRSYAETSVRDTGMHGLALCPTSVIDELYAEGYITTTSGNMTFTMAGATGPHPPRIEVYLGTHFITVSDKRFEDHDLRVVSKADIVKVIEVGRRISGRADKASQPPPPDNDDGTDIDLKDIAASYRTLILGRPPVGMDRSTEFQRLIAYFRSWTRYSVDQVTRLLEAHATTGPQSKYTERMKAEVERSWKAVDRIEPIERRPLPTSADDDIVPEITADFLSEELPPLRWLIDGILPEGLTLLAGPPKLGKSYLMLSTVLACTTGGEVLGRPVEHCGAMYFVLDDSRRRFQDRLRKMLAGRDCPRNLYHKFVAPKVNEQLVERLDRMLARYTDIGIVILDTLAHIRSGNEKTQGVYEYDFNTLVGLKQLAERRNIAIVAVTHDRKTPGEMLDTVSGSRGLTGTADSIIVMSRVREKDIARLQTVGKDIESLDKLIRFDSTTFEWSVDQDYQADDDDILMVRIMDAMRSGDPMRPSQIAKAVHEEVHIVRRRLEKLLKKGVIHQPAEGRGVYCLRPTADVYRENTEGEED